MRIRHTAAIVTGLAAITALLATGAAAAHAQAPSDILSVTYIQLDGKGDSTLVQLPNQKVVLVDGGLKKEYQLTLKPLLAQRGIDTIDLVIATHKDQDHLNGINGILEAGEFAVSAVWYSPELKNTTTITVPFYHNIEQKNIPLTFPTTGHRAHLDDSVSMEVLGPAEVRQFDRDNDNSIVTLLEYGDLEFLFTGDIEKRAEQWLVRNTAGDKLDIDIMNAPHHGSIRTSNTQQFITATSPGLVIHSADVGNQYGHPHQETIDLYRANGIRQLQTGSSGHITVQTDGARCSILFTDGTEAACFDGMPKLSEQPPPQDTTSDELAGIITRIMDIINEMELKIAALEAEIAGLIEKFGDQAPPPTQDEGDFIPIYYDATYESNAIQKSWYEDRLFLENFAGRLNQVLALPHDVNLTMGECHEENAFYYPHLKEITICYEYVTYLENLLSPHASTDDELFQMVDDHIIWVTLHELGHALVDVYDLPITGNEEDAVDQFATIVTLEYIEEEESDSILYATLIAWHETGQTDTFPSEMALAGQHSLGTQRYYNIMCWAYGSDPDTYSFFVDWGLGDRAAGCYDEYARASQSWHRLLTPFLIGQVTVTPPAIPPADTNGSGGEAPPEAPSTGNDEADRTIMTGSVFVDSNGNGMLDAGEPGASGRTLVIVNTADFTDAFTVTTDASGNYLIELDAGTYLVQIEGTITRAYVDIVDGLVTVKDLGI